MLFPALPIKRLRINYGKPAAKRYRKRDEGKDG